MYGLQLNIWASYTRPFRHSFCAALSCVTSIRMWVRVSSCFMNRLMVWTREILRPFCWPISVAARLASVRRTYSIGRYFANTVYVCPTSSAVSLKAFWTYDVFLAYHSWVPSSNEIIWLPLCSRVMATAWCFVGDVLLTVVTIALLSLVFRSSVMPGACTVSCLICRVGIIFACIAAADAADCSPVDRLPFAAMLAQVCLGCSSLAVFFIITLLRSFRLI